MPGSLDLVRIHQLSPLQKPIHSVFTSNVCFLAVLFRAVRAQTINSELNNNAMPIQIVQRAKDICGEKCVESLRRLKVGFRLE